VNSTKPHTMSLSLTHGQPRGFYLMAKCKEAKHVLSINLVH